VGRFKSEQRQYLFNEQVIYQPSISLLDLFYMFSKSLSLKPVIWNTKHEKRHSKISSITSYSKIS